MNYTNLERLELEIKGIDLLDTEMEVYLAENNLVATDTYDPTNNINKRAILESALGILEGIANNPKLMKTYKFEEESVSDFHENLMARIDQLDKKIRQLKQDEIKQNSSQSFYLFNS
ncbi:hypothetical protein [Schinkia azotoformans]|uniref:hypothetical protein n=1 Tax=Schinkia azotoformans TaxID=1454 RepID=UPI002DBC3DED|nr:hypothetical protein [Schinkia azotoformans]MEC1697761.1 hypothetical protein [Schinkia azotoformans]